MDNWVKGLKEKRADGQKGKRVKEKRNKINKEK